MTRRAFSAPIVNVIASIEACEALKILTGIGKPCVATCRSLNCGTTACGRSSWNAPREGSQCPACVRGEFPWLSGQRGSHTAVFCGRNAVQLSFPEPPRLSLEALEARLAGIGR